MSPGSRQRDQTLTEKAATAMLSARPPRDDEPRRPGEDFLTSKSLILLIIAGGIADLPMKPTVQRRCNSESREMPCSSSC